jgi:hypothetical protein
LNDTDDHCDDDSSDTQCDDDSADMFLFLNVAAMIMEMTNIQVLLQELTTFAKGTVLL